MMADKYDVAVIGAGPGGYVAAIRAAQLGMRVVCIEKETTVGGTCLNVGCIPSKALLQSSEYYHLVKHGGKEHGIAFKGAVTADWAAMQDRKNRIVAGLTSGVRGLLKKNKITLVYGVAQFVSPRMVEVSGVGAKKAVEADNFVVATGSESIPLKFLPFDERKVLSSTGALSLTAVPRAMVVVGAGVIGVEMASVYNRLGSKVTVVEMLDRVCFGMDQALSKMMLQILSRQGIDFLLAAQVMKGDTSGDGIKIVMGKDKKTQELDADVVLVAVGRRPHSEGLGLDKIGVNMSVKGLVTVDDNFRTNVPNVYAIGDLIEGVQLAHRASEEGVAVAEIIAGHTPHINYMAIPNIIYTSPEVAAVGLTELEAKEAGLDVMVGTFPFRANARARCRGDDDGLVKVVGEKRSGRLVGMHIIGPSASEMIHEGVVAIEQRATVEQIANMCHGHPTLSEAVKEAALDALGRAIHL